MRGFMLWAVLLVTLTGCNRDAHSTTSDVSARRADDPLTAADLESFLTVVQSHAEEMIPEFAPLDDDESLDFNAGGEELVGAYREQFKRVFDIQRQAELWRQDPQWSQALAGRKISFQRFAALVRDVSLGIMRVRLESRVDLSQLVAQARRQVDQIVRTMDEIDEVPLAERTRDASAQRTRCVIQLGRAVALLAFAELVRQVPSESAAVVRRYSRQLKPLLPASMNDELLAELKALATTPEGDVEPARFESPEDE
ncbi:MAG TPA: hypothetical protein VKU82_07510 [Planctomycetaceae bacterium]|nr:hypothetical protein [Planctomycetaceae bacterium]